MSLWFAWLIFEGVGQEATELAYSPGDALAYSYLIDSDLLVNEVFCKGRSSKVGFRPIAVAQPFDMVASDLSVARATASRQYADDFV